MIPLQKLQIRASDIRGRLAEIGGMEELTDETRSELGTLRTEYADNEAKQTALTIAGDEPANETRADDDGRETRTSEDLELDELRSEVQFGRYLAAALGDTGVSNGPEAEYNQHLGIAANRFPMELLARDLETRAARDGDAEASQGSWLDRVFAGSASQRLGVSFRNVAPGVASYPVTTAGGSPVQRGRTQDAAESTYTVSITELKPSRAAVHGIYSIEDDARLPGLAASIERDMRMAMTEDVDNVVFVGDSGANENVADITGLTSAGITESTLTQTNKVKGPETLEAFTGLVDGLHAQDLGDLNVVASVGAWRLWQGTIINAAADNMTLAAFMRGAGLSWGSREGIDVNTAAGDFGAYVGLANGIEGSAIAAVWSSGELIRDPYSGAKTGEVQLPLNYLWQLAFPRTANFKRLKFVA